MFALRSEGISSALTASGTVNQQWLGNLGLFFQDLATVGIYRVTPNPMLGAWTNNGEQPFTVTDSCTGMQTQLWFYPYSPIPYVLNPDGFSLSPYGWRLNNAYNCANAVPNGFFFGWQSVIALLDAVLGSAVNNGITVDELELHSELDLADNTVYGRLIYDNKNPFAPGGPPGFDVLSSVRNLMSSHGFDLYRATYDTGAIRTINGGSYDCQSVYASWSSGHISARVLPAQELLAAQSGQYFGWPTGVNESSGLPCDGFFSGNPILPVYYTNLPKTVDVHVYPCVTDTSYNCSTANPDIQADATTTFTAAWNTMMYFDCSPLCGFFPDRLMVGETWWTTNVGGCPLIDQAPTNAAALTVAGFNSAGGRAGTTVYFRPWTYIASSCSATPQVVNPPYTPSLW